MSKIKIFVFLIVVGIGGWGGYKGYTYFFDTQKPEIQLSGVELNGFIAGDIQCVVSGHDEYKVGTLSLWLDQKPLVSNRIINKKDFEYTFPLATRSLVDGLHTLKIVVKDASYHKNATTQEIPFTVDNVPLRAAFVTGDVLHKIFQGRTLHVQFQVNKPLKDAYVEVLSQKFPCVQEGKNSPIYECFIPIKSDEKPNEHLFSVHVIDNVGNEFVLTNKMQVVMYPFKKQRLSVKNYQPEEGDGRSEKDFEDAVALATQNSPRKKLWKSSFYVPCDISGISTAYGTLRTSQERGKYRHDALDLLAPPKSVIWASQDGVVVIKDHFVHSGNTVVIDHGCGILSMYFHLNDFADIAVGGHVKKGKPLGILGRTGYATGDHLHWELRVNNTAVDPMQWTKHDF